MDGGGDYLLPVKENQPTLQRDLADAFSPSGKQGARRQWRPGRNRNQERGATLTVWVESLSGATAGGSGGNCGLWPTRH